MFLTSGGPNRSNRIWSRSGRSVSRASLIRTNASGLYAHDRDPDAEPESDEARRTPRSGMRRRGVRAQSAALAPGTAGPVRDPRRHERQPDAEQDRARDQGREELRVRANRAQGQVLRRPVFGNARLTLRKIRAGVNAKAIAAIPTTAPVPRSAPKASGQGFLVPSAANVHSPPSRLYCAFRYDRLELTNAKPAGHESSQFRGQACRSCCKTHSFR